MLLVNPNAHLPPMKFPLHSLVLTLLLFVAAWPAVGQVPDQLKHSLLPVGAGPTAGSGFSVAVDGNLTVVGAPGDDAGALHSGTVRVYDTATGLLLHVLLNPIPSANTYFGWSVGISGTSVVVGVPYDLIGTAKAGSAYVYDISSATPTVPVAAFHNPAPADYDEFGYAVAISGTRVVIGVPGDDVGTAQSEPDNLGRVYIYDLSSATPTIPAAGLPNLQSFPNFGRCVGISGMRVVVAARTSETRGSGRVFTYDLSGAQPAIPRARLEDPGFDPFSSFGSVVAISGTRVVVGDPYASYSIGPRSVSAGSAYVYDVSSATQPSLSTTLLPVSTFRNPTPFPMGGEGFGVAAAISGTRMVVGASRAIFTATTGSASIYDLSSPTPTAPLATLNKPTPATIDGFGYAVAISGTNVVVGAPGNQGAAHIFGPSPYSLWKVSELNNQFAPDLGDPDYDGVSNLSEYGLLRSATIPNGAPTAAASALYAEGERLRLFVPRDPTHNDITVEVQATGDLVSGPWTTIATSTLGAPFTGPGYVGGDDATPAVKTVEVRDTVSISSTTQRWLRVKVTH